MKVLNFIKERKFLLIPWIVMYAIIITLAITISPLTLISLLFITMFFVGWIKGDFPVDLTGPATITTATVILISVFNHFKPAIQTFLNNLL